MLDYLTLILISGCQHANPGLLLARNPWYFFAIIINHHSLMDGNFTYFDSSPLPVIFSLQVGPKVAPLYVVQRMIVRIFFIFFILDWLQMILCT